ncbi:hypothetical protein X757_31830 [Mesorhizobium sp. LSHC414A00]|nr:hypothetical protein X757_31830 [Mesorhizobium sp. LSHC414A00]
MAKQASRVFAAEIHKLMAIDVTQPTAFAFLHRNGKRLIIQDGARVSARHDCAGLVVKFAASGMLGNEAAPGLEQARFKCAVPSGDDRHLLDLDASLSTHLQRGDGISAFFAIDGSAQP